MKLNLFTNEYMAPDINILEFHTEGLLCGSVTDKVSAGIESIFEDEIIY